MHARDEKQQPKIINILLGTQVNVKSLTKENSKNTFLKWGMRPIGTAFAEYPANLKAGNWISGVRPDIRPLS